MKPLGIKVKVALATRITSIVLFAVVSGWQAPRVRGDFTEVLCALQVALISRSAEELEDKLTARLGGSARDLDQRIDFDHAFDVRGGQCHPAPGDRNNEQQFVHQRLPALAALRAINSPARS